MSVQNFNTFGACPSLRPRPPRGRDRARRRDDGYRATAWADPLWFGRALDPFAEEADPLDGTQDVGSQQNYIHIRIQQRNGRKTLTTLQGLPKGASPPPGHFTHSLSSQCWESQNMTRRSF